MGNQKNNLRPTIKSALEKAAHFCSYQERSQFDVKAKLKKLHLDNDDIDEVIYHLINEDFLNEERFAKSFVRGKFNTNKWGKHKIRQHLQQKSVNDYCINLGLREIGQEAYQNTIESLVKKKAKALNEENAWKRNNKIINYLVQKGYDYEDIKPHLD